MPEMKRRIFEFSIRVPTLQLLAQAPNFELKTSELRLALEVIFNPTGEDAEAVHGNQSRFSQIVRNMVSNRHRGHNIVNLGFVAYIPNLVKDRDGSLVLLMKGLDALKAIGYPANEKLQKHVYEAQIARGL